MKNSITKTVSFLGMVTIAFAFTSCRQNDKKTAESDEVLKQVKELTATNEIISKNLATFDTLDYTVFSNRDWKRLHESHAKDIKVHFPDGHTEIGLEQHIKTLDAMFVYAPDTRIKEHPIKIGSGNMTAVIGYMEGTFTKPMPTGDGKFIEPTGKKFRLPMATIGIWKEDGTMSEEYLFWDNKTYMDQIMAK
ncbi:ester cyclase [Chryseobacterium gwangjuense]|uniref:ester cyclase n=1 Tax=Chryseobacterium gwangjuense TaxID=1069980 RepID=UPI001E3975D8|nr:nuclear transport factor 2 family protein [Chryseobacterium gwangjuense]MCE3076296.1 nuclear transport factor 2 family protein [Chryseobacterium gwangjuense]